MVASAKSIRSSPSRVASRIRLAKPFGRPPGFPDWPFLKRRPSGIFRFAAFPLFCAAAMTPPSYSSGRNDVPPVGDSGNSRTGPSLVARSISAFSQPHRVFGCMPSNG